MMTEPRRIVSCIFVLSGLIASASAFAPLSPSALRSSQHGQVQSQRRLRNLPSLNLMDPETVASVATSAANMADPAMLHIAPHLASASQLLADAADATADVAAAAAPTGWWGEYLNIFKNSLSFVHSAIDEPFRKMGIDQTWGISIAIFTFGIRSLLIPLSIQQSKSAEYTKALKPYMTEIRERFKNNENAMNQAMAKLYEDANQNPLSGCLLSFAQIPVFLGLYRGVRLLAIDGELQEPFLWIPSLEGPVSAPTYRGLEWLTEGWTPGVDGGLPIPSLGWETTLAFLIMPITLVLLQSLTMNVLQPPADDSASEEEKKTLESTQTVLKFLPLLIGFFSLQVPAGLTIYWFTSNIFTLTQSLSVRAYFAANPPDIQLPEYWDQSREFEDKDFSQMTPDERRKATEMGIRVGPTMEELIDEGRFHVLIEREPFRQETAAWERVDVNDKGIAKSDDIPDELKNWVELKMDDLKSANGEDEKHVEKKELKKKDKEATVET